MDRREHESEELGLPLHRVLTDRADRTVALSGLAVVVALLAAVVAIAVTAGGDASAWLYVALALVAVAILVFTYRRVLVWAGWGNPQLFLPSSDDLHLGDDVIVRFRRVARRGTDPGGLSITARLIAEEATRHGDSSGGDGVEHVTRVLDEPMDVVLTNVVRQTVEADIRVAVPLSEAPPTLVLPRNAIRWRLVVGIEAPNAPDDDSTFPLVVAPVVAVRLQSGGTGR